MTMVLTIDSRSSNRANSVDGISHGLGSTLNDFALSGCTDECSDQSLDLGEVSLQGVEVKVGLSIVDEAAERRLNAVEQSVELVQSRVKGGGDSSARDGNGTDGTGEGKSSSDSSELHFDSRFGLKRVTELDR